MDCQSNRIVVAGMIMILAGLIFGLVFSYGVDHHTRLITNDAYQPVFELISDGAAHAEWQALQGESILASRTSARAIDVHTHSINMGILVILMGLLYPVLSTGRRFRITLAISFVVAALLYPLGLFLQMLQLVMFGEIVAAIGAGLAVSTFGLVVVDIWRSLESWAKDNVISLEDV